MITSNLFPSNSDRELKVDITGKRKKRLGRGGSWSRMGVTPAAGTERPKPIGGPHDGICPASFSTSRTATQRKKGREVLQRRDLYQ